MFCLKKEKHCFTKAPALFNQLLQTTPSPKLDCFASRLSISPRSSALEKHLDSTPSFPTWKKLTSIPWTLRSYYNAPMIKITRSGPAGFLIILSSAERIILMSQTNWLLVPSMLATRFLGPKSVIISQAVTTKVVLSRMLSTRLGTWDKRPWPRAHGSAPLVTKTGIKICGNRPAPHLFGAQPTTVVTTALQTTSLWNIKVTWLQACVFPSLCRMFCRGKTMEMHSN